MEAKKMSQSDSFWKLYKPLFRPTLNKNGHFPGALSWAKWSWGMFLGYELMIFLGPGPLEAKKNLTIRQFLEAIQAFVSTNFEQKRTFSWGTELGQMVLGHVLGYELM